MSAYGPSPAAVEAALRWADPNPDAGEQDVVRQVADAMHDPALGADRSVCLRDVCEVLVAALPHEVDETDAAGVVELLMERFTERPNA